MDEAAQAFNQKLKHKLVAQGHFVKFKDRDGRGREAQTRQWPAGSPLGTTKEESETLSDSSFIVRVTAKATAPNGLYICGDGPCWSKTKEGGREGIYHNTRSHALTRAELRAFLELVGFGEALAEENDRRRTAREHG